MAIFGIAGIILGLGICVKWIVECVIYVIEETKEE